MFLVTQFIGLYVVNYYLDESHVLPFGMELPEEAPIECPMNSFIDFIKCTEYLYSLVVAFIIAVTLLFLFTKFELSFVLKLWFFVVVIIALGISFNSLILFKYSLLISLLLALPLSYIKIYKKEFLIHNFTELFIYPGIAAVFVQILNMWTIIILLILISIYDMWAVWHSGIMQKMAKYQIDKLNIFSGFFVPYLSKNMRQKIKKMKMTLKKSELKKKRIKINVAILGGGDIIFPIITAGVMLKTYNSFYPCLFVIAGATLGLSYLFFFAKKKKFYPAMPFITAGIFIGMTLSYFLL